VLLNHAHLHGLLGVESFGLTHEEVREAVSHGLLVLEEDFEELTTEHSEVLFVKELGVDLRKRVEFGVDLVLGDGGLVADESLELGDFFLVLGLEVLDVLLGDLHVRLKFKNVNQELTLVSQLIFVQTDNFLSAWLREIVEDIEEHGVFVRLLHDFSNFQIEVIDQIPSGMVDNLVETFETNTTLTNISVKQTDANDDIGQFAQLGDFLGSGQTDEGSEAGTREHRLEGSSDFSLDGVRNSIGQLDLRVVADDVLLVFVKQIVEDFLVEESDAFEIVTRARFKRHDLVDQAIGLVGEVGDVLLSSHFLFDVGGIVADLQHDSVQSRLFFLLKPLYSQVDEVFRLVL